MGARVLYKQWSQNVCNLQLYISENIAAYVYIFVHRCIYIYVCMIIQDCCDTCSHENHEKKKFDLKIVLCP